MTHAVLDIAFPGTVLVAAALSSVHCAGMCGPLVLNLDLGPSRVWYHLGRLLTYGLLGVAAGLLGHRLLHAWDWKWMAVATVWFLIVVVCLRSLPLLPASLWRWMQAVSNRSLGLFGMGALSGFLPCGQIHAFVAAAALSRHPAYGFLILFSLWLGSLPGLYFGPVILQKSLARLSPRGRRVVTVAVGLAGVFALTLFFGNHGHAHG